MNNKSDNIEIKQRKTILDLIKGSRRAFRKIFDQHQLKLYHFTRKMGLSHEDAEGIVQETFISLWKQKEKVNHDRPIQAYLYTITKRLTINKIRRLILEKNYRNNSSQKQTDLKCETEEYIIFTNMMEHANESIDKLPTNRKQIFMLSKHSGLSNQEIADKLNLSLRTVENQLYRASKTVRSSLNSDIPSNQ